MTIAGKEYEVVKCPACGKTMAVPEGMKNPTCPHCVIESIKPSGDPKWKVTDCH